MAIRVTEKEHWKERIQSKIDIRIQNLATENHELLTKLRGKAEQEAIKAMGISTQMEKIEELNNQHRETRLQLEKLERETRDRVVSKEKVERSYSDPGRQLEEAISESRKLHEERVYQGHEVGREILKLRRERENILDTVWLATSPKQVTELWDHVLKLLGEKTTEFQKEVLSGSSQGAE